LGTSSCGIATILESFPTKFQKSSRRPMAPVIPKRLLDRQHSRSGVIHSSSHPWDFGYILSFEKNFLSFQNSISENKTHFYIHISSYDVGTHTE
jgi:hypothetical protein